MGKEKFQLRQHNPKGKEGWRANKVREEASKPEEEQERQLKAKLAAQLLQERWYPLEEQK